MATKELTKENFEETIANNDIVFIDFWAEWCGPCKMFGPVFEKVSNNHPDLVFGKVNTEKEQELAATFQVRSIPMLMVFREEIGIFGQAGALPESALEELVGNVKGLDMDDVRKQIAEDEAKQADKE